MGFMNMNTLMAIVTGFFVAIIGWMFYEYTAEANDEYYRHFFDHCYVGRTTSLVLHQNLDVEAGNGPGVLATLGKSTEAGKTGQCAVVAISDASVTWTGTSATLYTEDSTPVSVVVASGAITADGSKAIASSQWRPPYGITKGFGGMSELLVSVVPVVVVLGYMASSFGQLFLVSQRQGSGDIKQLLGAVGSRVGLLLTLWIAISFSPIFLKAANNANLVNQGQLMSTNEFGDILSLGFSLVPVFLTIVIVSMAIVDTYQTGPGISGAAERLAT